MRWLLGLLLISALAVDLSAAAAPTFTRTRTRTPVRTATRTRTPTATVTVTPDLSKRPSVTPTPIATLTAKGVAIGDAVTFRQLRTVTLPDGSTRAIDPAKKGSVVDNTNPFFIGVQFDAGPVIYLDPRVLYQDAP